MKEQLRSIVLINQSAGYLMVDILHELAPHYDEIVLITGQLTPRNRPLPPRVKLVQIPRYSRRSSIHRIATWAAGFVAILWTVCTRFRKSHLLIVSNPPLNFFLPRLVKNSFSFLVYDVYPEALVGFSKWKSNSFFIKMWKRSNRLVFTRAQRVFTISDGRKKMMSDTVDPARIVVVPLWTDNDFFKPIPKHQNSFVGEQNMGNQFVVMYSGNIGRTHPVEIMVELAATMKDENVLFIIIGEGEKKRVLQERVAEMELPNLRLLPWQPAERIPYTFASADLAFVTLGEGASLVSVPSKTFNFLSVGVPLLCVADANSELASLVSQFQMGICVNDFQLGEMRDFIRSMVHNRELHRLFSQKALEASRHFTMANAQKFI